MSKAPIIVTLNGDDHEVVIPRDFAAQRELVVGVEANIMRGSCSIIGMMLPRLGFSHLYGACNCNSLVFGGRVWEGLVHKGIPETELPELGLVLYKILKPIAYPAESEVTGQMGNSLPQAAPSSGKVSLSSAPGEESPAGSPP
ncbi:MAG TPA: hypothetical protein ENL11_05955 [Candidatus Acetothermia bacterium]|nr:hypothetical protein [Candidatus Acetothermia bacterium]